MNPKRTLATLYRQRALLDVEIARLEDQVAQARITYGRRRDPLAHGDESSYQRHIRKRIPFPEDKGFAACGCRMAHAAYERQRAERKASE